MAEYRFLPTALVELEEALDWYAARSVTACSRFAESLEEVLTTIETTSELFPRIDELHRRARVKGFPYFIAYRMVGENHLIVAIRHTSRGDCTFDAS